MQRFWFALSIALLVGCSGNAGGPDAFCGVGNAATTIELIAGSTTLTYGNLTSIVGNDCSDTTTSVNQLDDRGHSAEGSGLLTLCIVRPDKLSAGPQLGSAVKVVDTSGSGEAVPTRRTIHFRVA